MLNIYVTIWCYLSSLKQGDFKDIKEVTSWNCCNQQIIKCVIFLQYNIFFIVSFRCFSCKSSCFVNMVGEATKLYFYVQVTSDCMPNYPTNESASWINKSISIYVRLSMMS